MKQGGGVPDDGSKKRGRKWRTKKVVLVTGCYLELELPPCLQARDWLLCTLAMAFSAELRGWSKPRLGHPCVSAPSRALLGANLAVVISSPWVPMPPAGSDPRASNAFSEM